MSRPRPAELVLGFTDPAGRADAERLVARDPLFRSEVERLQSTIAALEQLDRLAWRPESPPPLDSDRAVTVRRPRRAPRRRLAAVVGVAAATAAAALALVVPGDRPAPAPRVVALHPIGKVPGTATLALRGSDAELRGSHMPPSGPHDYYEAWLGDAQGRMVSMGTFRVAPDGSVDAHMPIAVDLRRYDTVDISLEPDDGNPAHSDRSVMRARI